MIKLHHLNNSRSQRVIWALKELEVDFEIVRYQRNEKTYLAPDSLKQVHPLGKAPILEDGDKVIAESAVIIDYLVSRYGPQLKPDINSEEYLSYQYWLHYSEGSLMPYMVMKLVFDKIKKSPMPFFARPIASKIVNKTLSTFVRPNIMTHLTYIEDHLKEHAWFCGNEISGADLQMIFPLEAACASGLVRRDSFPHIFKYVDKVHMRPAYQVALATTEDYDYA